LLPGVEIELRFAPDASDKPFVIPAIVMWRTPTAFGLQFKGIDEALSKVLWEIAQTAVQARLQESATGRREMTAEQRKIIRDCRRKLQKLVPNMIWTLRTDLASQRRTAAQSADHALKHSLMADADSIDAHAPHIGRTIEHDFLQGFTEATDMDETQELSLAVVQAASAKADMVETKLMAEQDDKQQAIIAALGHSAEERFKMAFFQLDVRLANIVGHALDREVNSLAPAVACRIMWRGVTAFHDPPQVQKFLRKTMQTKLIPLLGELIEAQQQTLDAAGAETYFDLNNG
jgi:hypothetical protein